MLYKFNIHYINLEDIVSMSCQTIKDPVHPYALTVYLRDHREYGIKYSTESDRNTEAWNIMQAHNRMKPEPVSRYAVESIVSTEMEKVRRDFRRLREAIKEERNNGKL